MARDYCVILHEYLEEMEELSEAEFGRLIRALLKHSMTGEPMRLEGNERYYARRVINVDNRFNASYEKTASARSENGKKGAAARWSGSDDSDCNLDRQNDGKNETHFKNENNNAENGKSNGKNGKGITGNGKNGKGIDPMAKIATRTYNQNHNQNHNQNLSNKPSLSEDNSDLLDDNNSSLSEEREELPARARGGAPATAPTLEEVMEFAQKRKSAVDPVRFFEYYAAGKWRDAAGNPVRSWKQKFMNWERDEKPPESGKDPPKAKKAEDMAQDVAYLDRLFAELESGPEAEQEEKGT